MAETQEEIDAFLTCFICLCRATEPKICPSCSKICCAECILKWLTENRSICPHCRSYLSVSSLVNARFVTEISEVVGKLVSKSVPSDACEVHSSPLCYFCATCSKMVCSDCAMFEPEHKGHTFERLGSIYEKKVEELKVQGEALGDRIDRLRAILCRIDGNVEELKRGKESVEADAETKLRELTLKLDSQLNTKLSLLSKQKSVVTAKISSIYSAGEEIETMLAAPRSRLVAAFPQLIQTVREQAGMQVVEFAPVSAEFDCGVKPDYSASTFILHDYLHNKAGTEVVYSEAMQVQREVWRLKVYPNGNGAAKGAHLSVFLELIKGGYGKIRYDYRIELVNQRDPALRLTREFSSEFEPGECWGYNRFLQLDKLLPEGYLDPSEDRLTFRFYVRPSSFLDLFHSQKRYIELLETENKLLAERQSELREQLDGGGKAVLGSAENPVTSPQPQQSSGHLLWHLSDFPPVDDLSNSGLLSQPYPLSPADDSCSNHSSVEHGQSPVQGLGWVSEEEENDRDMGNEGFVRSTWLEKRYEGLSDFPQS